MVIFTINWPAPPVIDLVPPSAQHLHSKLSKSPTPHPPRRRARVKMLSRGPRIRSGAPAWVTTQKNSMRSPLANCMLIVFTCSVQRIQLRYLGIFKMAIITYCVWIWWISVPDLQIRFVGTFKTMNWPQLCVCQSTLSMWTCVSF